MGHYDCKNCGHHLGIGWGSCESCTPKKYLELKKYIRQIYKETEEEWKEKIAKEKQEFFDKMMEKIA